MLNRCLLAVVAALLASLAAAQTANFVTSTIPGVEIFAAQGHSDLFEATVPDANGRDAVSPVMPLSVFVRNTGSRPILLFVVRWEFLNNGGKPVSYTDRRNFRTGPAFSTGGLRLITPVGGFTQAIANGQTSSLMSSGYSSQLQTYDTIARSSNVRVSLDSVVFSNGEFIGPDGSGIFATINATHEGAMGLIAELQQMSGSLNETIQARLSEIVTEQPKLDSHESALNQLEASSIRTAIARSLGSRLSAGRQPFEDALTALYHRYSQETIIWKVN